MIWLHILISQKSVHGFICRLNRIGWFLQFRIYKIKKKFISLQFLLNLLIYCVYCIIHLSICFCLPLQHLDYIPESLRKFFGVLAGNKAHEKQPAHIGHAMMQFTRPKILIPPLQLGLALMMHHHFASKFLNESLHAAGFASSYKEVCTFERTLLSQTISTQIVWQKTHFYK